MLRKTQIKRYLLITAAVWTIIICISLIVNIIGEIYETRNIAIAESRAYLDKDQAFRLWATSHGGVYVPIDETTAPNPYLSHIPNRDIIKPSGDSLTLMNPSYMVRQINEMYSSLYGVNSHITSLTPLRPENEPDKWERQALMLFKRGEEEVQEFTSINGEPYLRLMRPVITDENCLTCHGYQDYQVEDINGGVGISLPMEPIKAITREHMHSLAFWHFFLWTIGIAGIWLGFRTIAKRVAERYQAEEKIRMGQARFETLYNLSQMTDESDKTIKNFALEESVRMTNSKIGYIYFMNKDETELTLHSWSKNVMKECTMIEKPTVFKVSETGLWGEAVRKREPVITNNYDAPNPCKKGYPVGHVPIKRHMNLPIIDNGKIVIIAGVGNKEDEYDETDVRQLTLIMTGMWQIIQKKKAGEIIKTSEANLKRAQEVAHVGSWYLNIVENKLEWSDEVYRIFGLMPGESLTYEKFLERVHPDDRNSLDDAWKAALNHKPYDIEHRILVNDEVKWVREKAEVEFDDRGIALRGIGSVQDITIRKQAENALRSNEMLMSAIYKDAPLPMILIDSKRRIHKINKTALKFARRSEEKTIDLLDCEALRCIHAFDDPRGCGFGPACETCAIRNTILDSFKTHRNHHSIEALIPYDSNGNVVNLVVLISTSFLEMPEGDMVLVCLEDITERKQAVDALRSSEENYRSLIDNIPDVVWTADQAGHITFISDNITEIYGYTPEEIYQDGEQLWLSRIHPDDIYRVKEAFEAITHEDQSFDIEYRIKRKDDQWIWLHDRAIKTHNELEKTRVDGVFSDITERKKAVQVKEKLETQLRQAQKMESIGTLAGGIAHDFNNILSSVIGYTELAMLDSDKNSNVYRCLNEILVAGTRAADLVTQILTFSRQVEQEFKPISIRSIVKESLKLLRGSLPSTIEIRQRIGECGLVLADPTQIHQLIMNLCTNAYQAMGEHGGILEISLTEVEITDEKASSNADFKPGKYNKLTISDTGSGMDKETQKRIFEPYFTTKEVGKGTGLGLAIVHGIIKSCNGVTTVYSEPGEGTTFNIFLPIIQKTDGVIELKRAGEVKAIRGNERILFVDDEEPLVKWGKTALERFGYKVTSLTSSVEALELFRETADSFDIVITDMTMPNMIGSELARKMKEIRHSIPIILCTGFSELVKRKKYQEDLIQEYLSKPIIINDLANAIRRVLDSKEKVMT